MDTMDSTSPPLPQMQGREGGDATHSEMAADGDGRQGPKTKWTHSRVARLGFLIGLGHTAEAAAADPLIRSTANNVHRQAQRFGISFRERSGIQVTPETRKILTAAAAKRQITFEALAKLILTVAAEDNMIDNILDDEA